MYRNKNSQFRIANLNQGLLNDLKIIRSSVSTNPT